MTISMRDTVWKERDKIRNAAVVVEFPIRSSLATVKVFAENGEELDSMECDEDNLAVTMDHMRCKYQVLVKKLMAAIQAIEECNL